MVGESDLLLIGVKNDCMFQSRCRDWVVGEFEIVSGDRENLSVSVSLPRLGGWRAVEADKKDSNGPFQSRCRDWVVGEAERLKSAFRNYWVSVSLPRLGGWRGLWVSAPAGQRRVSVSLPRLGGWRAINFDRARKSDDRQFQSRCRDWVVGEERN